MVVAAGLVLLIAALGTALTLWVDVPLRLEERIPNTHQWRLYTKAMYTLKRSFASDFDF